MTTGSTRQQVLIVEDDAAVRESLAEVLHEEGFCVRTAVHGQEAWRLLREGYRPAVVLLDLMMPVMDGWRFREAMLGDPSLAGIPVVITTALSPDYRVENSLQAAAYLVKPMGVEEVLATIASVVH